MAKVKTEEWKSNIRNALRPKMEMPDYKEKQRISHLGNKNGRWIDGRSVLHHKKCSLCGRNTTGKKYCQKCYLTQKNPFWKGGVHNEPYPGDWTKTLRRSIRERDKYTCQICGQEPSTHVHHIDYEKKNCNPNNLITLCHSCHNKTNTKREYWKRFFVSFSNLKKKGD